MYDKTGRPGRAEKECITHRDTVSHARLEAVCILRNSDIWMQSWHTAERGEKINAICELGVRSGLCCRPIPSGRIEDERGEQPRFAPSIPSEASHKIKSRGFAPGTETHRQKQRKNLGLK
ncbi:hypothetical protein NDU88_000682 [Pleurodeles waltl]|uniref:Uncharacterized protein n=1 Tax=Pleurodeles waltl TaxID=8319 RepID=A0AAV7TGF3_PLEWA|nr:hypothetical protein NDU88_000682 [Pleurodeles waltl]